MDYLPSLHDTMTKQSANELSPLVLAFVGDSVQTLYVRTSLVSNTTYPPNMLHKLAVEQIKATSQATAVTDLYDIFNDEERAIYKRARNSRVASSAKNAGIIEYKKASGYEAVIGYLYLIGEHERLNFLLNYHKKESNQ